MDATWVSAVGRDLAAGLAHIHRRGIVHRDVKPANVMLPVREHGDGPVAKLVDFGIAQHADQEKLTRTGMTIGTARYLAPEQVTGKPVGPAADVYALGIVLLEALGCGPAWTGTPIEIALARLTAPPAVPADLGPVWTPLLVAMTATDPLARPGATAVREALTTGVVPQPPPVDATRELPPVAATTQLLPTTAPSTRPRHRRRLAVVGAGVLAAGVAATVVGIALAAGSSDPTTPGEGARTSPAAAVSSSSAAVTPSSTVPSPVSTPTAAAPTAAAPTPPVVTSAAEGPATPGGPGKVPPGQTKSEGKEKDKAKG